MINDKGYQDRVALGKAVETKILDVLRRQGIKITEPAASEDMHDKIDGWMEWHSKMVPVQVKFRESGDDVLFEIVKDLDQGIMGRDMECKALFYLVKNRDDLIRMFSVTELKEKSKAIYDFVLSDMKKHPEKESWGGSNVTAKIVIDKAHRNRKLIAYFNPQKLQVFGEWK